MSISFDCSKTLQQLEDEDWGESQFRSGLVVNAHRLRRVPLREFTVDDLRLMIGQQISLRYLIPIALEHLQSDPLTSGYCTPGELLATVLRADSRFWIESPQWRAEVAGIALRALSLLPNLDDADRQQAQASLADAHDIFQRAEYFAQHGRA